MLHMRGLRGLGLHVHVNKAIGFLNTPKLAFPISGGDLCGQSLTKGSCLLFFFLGSAIEGSPARINYQPESLDISCCFGPLSHGSVGLMLLGGGGGGLMLLGGQTRLVEMVLQSLVVVAVVMRIMWLEPYVAKNNQNNSRKNYKFAKTKFASRF